MEGFPLVLFMCLSPPVPLPHFYMSNRSHLLMYKCLYVFLQNTHFTYTHIFLWIRLLFLKLSITEICMFHLYG